MIDRATIDSPAGNATSTGRPGRTGCGPLGCDSHIGVATFHRLITDGADPQGHWAGFRTLPTGTWRWRGR